MTVEDWSVLQGPTGVFDRVVVLDEAASTQDEARRLADGRSGLAVIARRQTNGRGRQGRAWLDADGRALSMTLVVPNAGHAARFSLAAGLAVIEACEGLGATGLGLKWPNDVVEHGGRHRKLAGVLIEVVGGMALVGIGLNVLQEDGNWAHGMEREAVSLAQLSVRTSRPEVARGVLRALPPWLDATEDVIRQRWSERGTLRGCRCVFRVDGRSVLGTVVGLDEQWRLVLETPEGVRIRIDAAHAHLEETVPAGSLS